MYSYPDVVEAEIVFKSTPPPIDVLSKSSGYIDSIFVNEKEYIVEDQPLALIKNNINYNQVLEVEKFTNQCLLIENPIDFLTIEIPLFSDLGELGDEYLSLYNNFSLLITDLNNSNVSKQIEMIRNEQKFIEKTNNILENEKKLIEQETELLNSDFHRAEDLYSSNMISLQEFEKEKIKILQQKQKNKTISQKLLDKKISDNNLSSRRIQLESDRVSLIRNRLSALNASIIRYKLKLNDWKEKYLIISPFKGYIAYTLLDNEKLFVNENDVVFTIIPSDTISNIHADCFIPIKDFGKIGVKSKLNIRLSSYPHEEFGSIESYIEDISPIPIDRKESKEVVYLAKVHLQNPIITNYQDTIPFKNELRGVGRIITKERNIFERIFEKVFSEIKNI